MSASVEAGTVIETMSDCVWPSISVGGAMLLVFAFLSECIGWLDK